MRVRLVSITETAAARAAGAPALTPEMLASVGARYSRNGEGLDEILALVDRSDPEKSIDTIFRMVDYGHQSIADMTPVPMFMDGVSLWLIYYLWSVSARASGQESSTRYIRFDKVGIVDPELAGIPEQERAEWHRFIAQAMDHYTEVAGFWEAESIRDPSLMRLPSALLDAALKDPTGKEGKQIARLRRNFIFDRARYWIPSAALSNVMMLMSARDWVGLCQNLLSHPVPEARTLGAMIRDELALSAPRLLRHARQTDDWVSGHKATVAQDAHLVAQLPPVMERNLVPAYVDVNFPTHSAITNPGSLTDALAFHPSRYSWTGRELARVQARYGLDAVAFAELRDLNRHRTGYKYCPFVPTGFYGARDEVKADGTPLDAPIAWGVKAAEKQRERVGNQDTTHPYWSLLGTQVPFEHGTTLDKLVYEIEIRTGLGAHYRYAEHMRRVHDRLLAAHPELAGHILLGSAEPE